jgi:hypothetical protein
MMVEVEENKRKNECTMNESEREKRGEGKEQRGE